MGERPGGPAGSRGEGGQGRDHGDDGDGDEGNGEGGGAAARAKAAALLLAGGLGLGPRGAAAFTRVLRSDDGKLVLICHDDDRTRELAFCDVHWFPLTAEGGLAGATGVKGSVGKVGAGSLAVEGELVAVAPGRCGGCRRGRS